MKHVFTIKTMSKTLIMIAASGLLMACGSKNIEISATSSAQDVYSQTCAGCHECGLKGWLTGAPKTGDKEAWAPIVAKGVDALTAISIQGVEKMPARGGCDTCSDDQIKAAVEYMVSLSK